MTVSLLLLALLAAPDAGAAAPGGARAQAARAPDAGVRPGPGDGGVPRAEGQRSPPDGGPSARPIVTRAPPGDDLPEPSTRISVQEPARPDAGTPRKKKARSGGTNGESDPQMDALLEQSRAQTEALQQISAQQRATEEARIAEQQARSQRGLQYDDARGARRRHHAVPAGQRQPGTARPCGRPAPRSSRPPPPRRQPALRWRPVEPPRPRAWSRRRRRRSPSGTHSRRSTTSCRRISSCGTRKACIDRAAVTRRLRRTAAPTSSAEHVAVGGARLAGR